jgi:hypothetical protein
MGYNHYWERPVEIEPEPFELLVADFQRCVLALDDSGVHLGGPMGEDLPQVDRDVIAFNGVRDCGHVKNEAISIPFPSEDASGVGRSANAIVDSWLAGVQIRHRTCNGDCSYEPFVLERIVEHGTRDPSHSSPDDRLFGHCKTGFRPYDLAVQCALLIARHRVGDRFVVQSSGSDWHWRDAHRICYVQLGYPLSEFRMDRDAGLIKRIV